VNTPLLLWFAAAILILLLLLVLLMRERQTSNKPLPMEWALAPRAVFSSDERRIYRLLREALPHHVILSKLPLVRFCQPTDSKEVRYWYDLLGTSHITFAVCSANGRVLAAIDLESEKAAHTGRVSKIKKSVLQACRVRHMVCQSDPLPTVAELQMLVPHSGTATRLPQAVAAPTLNEARDNLASAVASRRAQRTALWQDSSFFQDSFFAMDSRFDAQSATDFTPLVNPDGGGVVVDAAQPPPRR
jgi:hypothetical protein